jgi:hypothetical protein
VKKSALLALIKNDIDRVQVIHDEHIENGLVTEATCVSEVGTKLRVLKIIYEQVKALDSLE